MLNYIKYFYMNPELPDSIISKKFGKLTVICSIPVQSKSDKRFRTHYKCKCDCGEERITTKYHLVSGHLKSCGCNRKLLNSESRTWRGYGDIPLKYFNNIKHHATVLRNIKFELTIEEIWELFLSQDRKCALSGTSLQFPKRSKDKSCTASLDRIDSSKGYVPGNVQWVHKDINIMKNKFDNQYFIEICKLVAQK